MIIQQNKDVVNAYILKVNKLGASIYQPKIIGGKKCVNSELILVILLNLQHPLSVSFDILKPSAFRKYIT